MLTAGPGLAGAGCVLCGLLRERERGRWAVACGVLGRAWEQGGVGRAQKGNRGTGLGPRKEGEGREVGRCWVRLGRAGKRGSGLGCLRSGRVPRLNSIYSLFSILNQTKV